MNRIQCPAEEALVVLVDIQPKFMAAIHEADRVVRRARFIMESARILDIPIIATEQNTMRMGGLDESLTPLLSVAPLSKMAFSCWGAAGFQEALDFHQRSNIVLIGIETHICVTLTGLDLISNGYNAFVCPDAVSARTPEMHKLGMERMRDSGVKPSHTETLVYEWMQSADHPKFREVLGLVKES